MKKPDRFLRRVLMSAIGVIVCGVSVGMFKHASLGVDPFQSLMSGLDAVIPLHFGTLYVIANLVLLLFALLFDRRKIGLATLINLFLLGYIAEFSQGVCARLLPDPSLPVRLALLAAAIVIMCLASAFYFTADLGVSTYDAVALIWSEKQKRIPFPVCRIVTDLFCVVCGVILCAMAGFTLRQIFGEVGAGTIITAFFMGPLIELFNQKAARPFLYGKNEADRRPLEDALAEYVLSCDFGYDVTSPIPSVEPLHKNAHCVVPAVVGTTVELFPGESERYEFAEFVSNIMDENGQNAGIKCRIRPSPKIMQFFGDSEDLTWEVDLLCGKEVFVEDNSYENGKNTHTYRRLLLQVKDPNDQAT